MIHITWIHMLFGTAIGVAVAYIGIRFDKPIVFGIGSFIFMFCGSYLDI